jgi:hypothetical protein
MKQVCAVCRIVAMQSIASGTRVALPVKPCPLCSNSRVQPRLLLHCCNTLLAIEDESHFRTRSSLVFREPAAQDKIMSEGAGGQPVEAGHDERTG